MYTYVQHLLLSRFISLLIMLQTEYNLCDESI
jgi:hypothetical protein